MLKDKVFLKVGTIDSKEVVEIAKIKGKERIVKVVLLPFETVQTNQNTVLKVHVVVDT